MRQPENWKMTPLDAMLCSNQLQILKTARKLAAIPEEVSIAATPPSMAAIFSATKSLVGF